MSKRSFESYLNFIHLGDSMEMMRSFPDHCIDFTLTSPPFYDDDLYILEDGKPEFGWADYSEYLQHLEDFLCELFRVTKPGSRLAVVLSNTPHLDPTGRVEHFYPIVHDFAQLALTNGWILVDEAIWAKRKPSYHDIDPQSSPNGQIIPHHDWISVFKKPGDREDDSKHQYTVSSIWELEKDGGQKYSKYNIVYSSFPDLLIKNCLDLYTLEGDVVFDPYCGSGQVIRVALANKRKALGIEIDKRWLRFWEDVNLELH